MSEKKYDDQDLAMAEFHKKGIVNTFEEVKKIKEYGGKEFELTYRKQPLEIPCVTNFYDEFKQETTVINGDILYERDFEVTLSDGKKMYVDIYRPVGATNLPVIMSWTPFGKRHWHGLGIAPGLHQAMGVPKGSISNMAAFEACDPSFWCRNGYAIVNVDAPGVGHSEGDFNGFCSQYGKEGYDCIEFIAGLDWSNGKVGLAGNSGLAIAQWFIAAEQPPHLAAIAPWEGLSDFYRESVFAGGIPFSIFGNMIFSSMRGKGTVLDCTDAVHKYPLMNEMWDDMRANLEKIKVPAYVTAGYSHPLHLRGSVQGFMKMRSRHKWLRLHREFEWPDFNNPKYMQDLKLFFDRYLKEIYNGWELTPKVRVEVMDAYGFDYQTDRPETDFPIPRTEYKKLYLDASNCTLNNDNPTIESSVSYDAQTGEANFDIEFKEDTEITGFTKLKLWVEADGNDEMDLFVYMSKLDKDGNLIPTHVFGGEPDPGAYGKMRVSHRTLDEKLSKDYLPVQSHLKEEKLKPGEIVAVEIEISVTSRIWHKGEKLRLNVAPRMVRDESWFFPTLYETDNKGKHIIHTGGKYDSYVQVPVIPPRYKSGEYIFR